MIRNRNSVVTSAAVMEVLTVGGEMSSQELLQKRLASELDALRGLLNKAELISQRGACKGGAPTAGNKERFLASKQRPKPIVEDFNAPSVKKRKIATPVEQEQKQKQIRAPRMSQEEKNQLFCRLSSLSGEVPGHIVEFLQKHFGDADSHGEIEINIDSVKDSVLFELKTRLDKFAEQSKDDKVAEESKREVVPEQEKEPKRSTSTSAACRPLSKPAESRAQAAEVIQTRTAALGAKATPTATTDECVDRPVQAVRPEQTIATSAQPPSSEPQPAQAVQPNTEAKKVQDVQRAAPKAITLAGLIYRANLRRQLLEMERAKLPDESVYPRDLQRLGIMEHGHPSLMGQLGLVVKVDA